MTPAGIESRPAKTNSGAGFRAAGNGSSTAGVETLSGLAGLSEQFFREMIDALPAAIYTTDAEGRLTHFNRAAEELSGRRPELGTDQWCVTWKLFQADGTPLPHDQCPMAIALKGGSITWGEECIAERPDGSRFWFTPYPTALRDGDGRIVGGVNMLVDITSRKAAEEALRRSEECFRAIIETTPECVKTVGADGTLLHMNSAGLAMVGASCAEEVVGKSVYDLIAPEFRDVYRAFNEKICRGERGTLEFDIIGLQGNRRHVETHAAPFREPDGREVQLAITRDVTERRHRERSSLLLAAIVDSSDDAIISKDLNGTITSWNKSAERLFGYTAAETVGKPITILIPPDRLNEEPEILSRLRRGERVDHLETIRRRKDGTLVDISLTISPVRDGQGKIVGASKIARDISERKRSERAIQALTEQLSTDIDEQKRVEDELRRANQDLEQFAYSASHDLQEPLRSIKIYSELLTERYAGKLDGQAFEFLDYLRTGASRMEMLVRDLLIYTQVTRIENPAEPVDANEALGVALANLSGAIVESGASVTNDPLPSVRMHSAHLRQLFQNLIGNAIKYRNPERPPAVKISAERQNGSWIFAVRDNGIGIEPEYKEHVFGLFKRLHTSDEYSGTGIGLAICQRIAERYHGRIWVESEPGRGSTFIFAIPA